MEKIQQTFNLIEGKFGVTEAKELLLTLFEDKIRFHTLKSFSHQERFGKPDQRALKRVEVLKKTREDLLAHLDLFNGKTKYEIHADIKIKPAKPAQ